MNRDLLPAATFLICLTIVLWMLPPFADAQQDSEPVILRYRPQTGGIYTYAYENRLKKTTFGKTALENLDGMISLKILGKEDDRFFVNRKIDLHDSNINKMTFDKIKEMHSKPLDIIISDRYEYDSENTHNLCFPEQPVWMGSVWKG